MEIVRQIVHRRCYNSAEEERDKVTRHCEERRLHLSSEEICKE